jgi:hypothetical protein
MMSQNEQAPAARDRIQGCFYCGLPGPYTGEHVVSAGLGGDDPEWMLEGCVCTVCNNQTFSRLESHVLKVSYVALMRLLSQPATRDGTPPGPLQAPTTVDLGHDGPHAAGDFAAEGQARVFAQILFENLDAGANEYGVVAPDRESADQLFATVRQRLGDEIVLIEKHGARLFTATTLEWTADRYVAVSSASLERPVANAIWFEPEYLPPSAERKPAWTLFQRSGGQLVGRAPDLNHLRGMLSVLRTDLSQLSEAFDVSDTPTSTTQPGVHMEVMSDQSAIDRVLVKIGLNLVAHLVGLDVVRWSTFDAAVAFVLGETDAIPRALLPHDTLGPPLDGHHMLFLSPYPLGEPNAKLVLIARLYGAGPTLSYVLANRIGTGLTIPPIVVDVDYKANRITRVI